MFINKLFTNIIYWFISRCPTFLYKNFDWIIFNFCRDVYEPPRILSTKITKLNEFILCRKLIVKTCSNLGLNIAVRRAFIPISCGSNIIIIITIITIYLRATKTLYGLRVHARAQNVAYVCESSAPQSPSSKV